MGQVQKDHVRDAFVSAAGAAFAELGYAGTSMALVAERAGSSVGNLYKYFSSKSELFEAVVPPRFGAKLERLAQARMAAFGDTKDVRELPIDARYHALAGALLDFSFQHRAAVVIVLARGEGTPHASFRGDFVGKLVGWSLAYAARTYPALRPSAELEWVLRKAYESFVSGVADALYRFPSEPQARAVIALLTAQHQGGLKRLFETAGDVKNAPQPSHAQSSPVTHSAAGARASDPPSRGASASPARAGSRQADRRGRTGRRG